MSLHLRSQGTLPSSTGDAVGMHNSLESRQSRATTGDGFPTGLSMASVDSTDRTLTGLVKQRQKRAAMAKSSSSGAIPNVLHKSAYQEAMAPGSKHYQRLVAVAKLRGRRSVNTGKGPAPAAHYSVLTVPNSAGTASLTDAPPSVGMGPSVTSRPVASSLYAQLQQSREGSGPLDLGRIFTPQPLASQALRPPPQGESRSFTLARSMPRDVLDEPSEVSAVTEEDSAVLFGSDRHSTAHSLPARGSIFSGEGSKPTTEETKQEPSELELRRAARQAYRGGVLRASRVPVGAPLATTEPDTPSAEAGFVNPSVLRAAANAVTRVIVRAQEVAVLAARIDLVRHRKKLGKPPTQDEIAQVINVAMSHAEQRVVEMAFQGKLVDELLRLGDRCFVDEQGLFDPSIVDLVVSRAEIPSDNPEVASELARLSAADAEMAEDVLRRVAMRERRAKARRRIQELRRSPSNLSDRSASSPGEDTSPPLSGRAGRQGKALQVAVEELGGSDGDEEMWEVGVDTPAARRVRERRIRERAALEATASTVQAARAIFSGETPFDPRASLRIYSTLREKGHGLEMDEIFRPSVTSMSSSMAISDLMGQSPVKQAKPNEPATNSPSPHRRSPKLGATPLGSSSSDPPEHLPSDVAALLGDPHSQLGTDVVEAAEAIGLTRSERRGQDRVFRSPFLPEDAQMTLGKNALQVSKRVKARTTWGRVAHAIGKPSSSSGAGGGGQRRNSLVAVYDLKGRNVGVEGGPVDQFDPDLSGGHPYEVIQSYLLWRLGVTPSDFDARWRAEAFASGGGAITGYRGKELGDPSSSKASAILSSIRTVSTDAGGLQFPKFLRAVADAAAKTLQSASTKADAKRQRRAEKLLQILGESDTLASPVRMAPTRSSSDRARPSKGPVRQFGKSVKESVRAESHGLEGKSWKELRAAKKQDPAALAKAKQLEAVGGTARQRRLAEEQEGKEAMAMLIQGYGDEEAAAVAADGEAVAAGRLKDRQEVWGTGSGHRKEGAASGAPEALRDADAGRYFGEEGKLRLFLAYGRARVQGLDPKRAPPVLAAAEQRVASQQRRRRNSVAASESSEGSDSSGSSSWESEHDQEEDVRTPFRSTQKHFSPLSARQLELPVDKVEDAQGRQTIRPDRFSVNVQLFPIPSNLYPPSPPQDHALPSLVDTSLPADTDEADPMLHEVCLATSTLQEVPSRLLEYAQATSMVTNSHQTTLPEQQQQQQGDVSAAEFARGKVANGSIGSKPSVTQSLSASLKLSKTLRSASRADMDRSRLPALGEHPHGSAVFVSHASLPPSRPTAASWLSQDSSSSRPYSRESSKQAMELPVEVPSAAPSMVSVRPGGELVKFDQSTASLLVASQHSDEFETTQSPRTAFVRACADAQIPPESLIVRKRQSPVLDLAHFGVGDTRAIALAIGLAGLPRVDALVLMDNRLTARGVEAIAVAVAKRGDVNYLNLSANKPHLKGMEALAWLIGASGSHKGPPSEEGDARPRSSSTRRTRELQLPPVLQRPSTIRSRLRRLDLADCGLCTSDALPLLSGLGSVKFLRRLSLTSNGIDEHGARVLAEAIAEGCSLRHLFLAWNDITATGANVIAEAAAMCTTPLKTLDLSWCSVDDAAAGSLGTLIAKSGTLRALLLSNNRIGPSGATLIADGLSESGSLVLLDLSYCPVGAQGARMLLQQLRLPDVEAMVGSEAREAREALIKQQRRAANAAMRSQSSRSVAGALSGLDDEHAVDEDDEQVLKELGGGFASETGLEGDAMGLSGGVAGLSTLSEGPQSGGGKYRRVRLVGCDFRRAADTINIDPSNPSGNLTLDLAQPYHRAIAERLLRVAVENEECEFVKIMYRPPAGGLRHGHLDPTWERALEDALKRLEQARLANDGKARSDTEQQAEIALREELEAARSGASTNTGSSVKDLLEDDGTSRQEVFSSGFTRGRRASAVGAIEDAKLAMIAARSDMDDVDVTSAEGAARLRSKPISAPLSIADLAAQSLRVSSTAASSSSGMRVERPAAPPSRSGDQTTARRGSVIASSRSQETSPEDRLGGSSVSLSSSRSLNKVFGQGGFAHPLGSLLHDPRPFRIAVRRVQEKYQRSKQLWGALRSHMTELAHLLVRQQLADSELPNDPGSARAQASALSTRQKLHATLTTRSNLGIRVTDVGAVINAYFVQGANDASLGREKLRRPSKRQSRSSSASRTEDSSSDTEGRTLGTLQSIQRRRSSSTSSSARRAVTCEQFVTVDTEKESSGIKFELPYAGLITARVRAGWIDPSKLRRRADEARRRQARQRLASRQQEISRLNKALESHGDNAHNRKRAERLQQAMKQAEEAINSTTGGSFVDTLIHVMSSAKTLRGDDGDRDESVARGRGTRGSTLAVAQTSVADDRLSILQMSVPDLYLSCSEAVRLLMTDPVREADVGERVRIVARLLERLVDPPNAPALLKAVLPEDERVRVMAALGLSRFRMCMGYATGRYALDLSSAEDRKVLHRLASVSRENKEWLDTRFPGLDTSQWGDFERFRNARYAGEPLKLTEQWAKHPPNSGIVEFDFVEAKRPPPNARPIHSLRLAQIIRASGLAALRKDVVKQERAAVLEQAKAEGRIAAEAALKAHEEISAQEQQHRRRRRSIGVNPLGADEKKLAKEAKEAAVRGLDTTEDSTTPRDSRSRNTTGAVQIQGGTGLVGLAGSEAAQGRQTEGEAGQVNESDVLNTATADARAALLLRGAKAVSDAHERGRVGVQSSAQSAADVAKAERAQMMAAALQSTAREPLKHTDKASRPLFLDLLGRGLSFLPFPTESDPDSVSSISGNASTWAPSYPPVFERPPIGVRAADAAAEALALTTGKRVNRSVLMSSAGQGKMGVISRLSGETLPPTALAVASIVSQEREQRARSGNKRAGAALRPENRPIESTGTEYYRINWHASEVCYCLDWAWQDEDRRDPVDRLLAAAAIMDRSDGAAGGGSKGGVGWRLEEALEAQALERSRLLAVKREEGDDAEMPSSAGEGGGEGQREMGVASIGHAVMPMAATASPITKIEVGSGVGRPSSKSETKRGGGRRRSVFDEPVAELDLARRSFEGPPEFVSALAAFPNDLPLPPFDQRRNMAPRTTDTSGLRMYLTESGEEVEDEPAVATDEALPEMRFRYFPELFQPVRITAVSVNTPVLQMRGGVFLLELLSALSRSYVTARQVADIIRMLPLSIPGLRIEVAVCLFPRVVDLPEFDRVLFALSGPERRRVVLRIGWLNLWNPARPDGDYVLDLRLWEERVLATMLAQLSLSEGSETMRGPGGRGGPDFNRIAGWRLPTGWMQETPSHGILRMHYSSYETNVSPSFTTRRQLCRHVLTYC
jgi:hypothetical protein